MLYHDGRSVTILVCNVCHRLPEAEQQTDDQNSEHADDDVKPLLWRECIKPFLDTSRYALFDFNYLLLHFFTVLMSLFSTIVKFRIWKPLGLSSERLEFIRWHSVTNVRSVTLLSRIIVCLAYVLT